MQPETENPNPMGGADREAASSHAELRAILGLLLGLKQVFGDPGSHFLKQAGKAGTELILTFFFLRWQYFQIHVSKSQ